MLILMFVILSQCIAADGDPVQGTELLTNGDFSGPLKFNLYQESGGNASVQIQNGELRIDVNSIGRVTHAVQPYYDGFRLVQGVEYLLRFDARSDLQRDMYVRIQLNGGDYHAYFEQNIYLTEETRHFSFPFVMAEASDPAPRLCVNMGFTDAMAGTGLQPEAVPPHKVYFDNFSLTISDASGAAVSSEGSKSDTIRINQVGYLPEAPKTAVFENVSADSFSVVKLPEGNTVFTGSLTAPVWDPYTGETESAADFSSLTEPGTYKIISSDGAGSSEFTVGSGVYRELLKSAVRMLYLQRCGTELESSFAGKFAHPGCHTEPAGIYGTDEMIDVSGGWHDAGDYGRYVVTGAKAAADLLLSYELNSGLMDDLDIPESGDGIDDRLQEARYELSWMLKMQAGSGGVYHKVTGYSFPGFIKPQEDTGTLAVSPVSVTATGDFAGVMALAARVFAASGVPGLAAESDVYLRSAERAWNYLEGHRNDPGFINPPDIVTGEYPDAKADDERFWAAAELYRNTGKDEYREAVSEALASGRVTAEFGWVEMGGYGICALLEGGALPEDDEIVTGSRRILSDAAYHVRSTAGSHPYGVSRMDHYEWGSNMGIANDGVLLLMGASFLGDPSLKSTAARQLDYLLGENAAGYSFVTGTGTKSPQHPHHRPSVAFGETVPGMLVGGPDSSLEDPYMQNVMAGCSPAKCYADSDQSYSTNEVCVYWNSPLILLISGLTAD